MIIEIILLFFMCRAVGNVMRNKGRTAIWMQLLMVAMLFLGEFMGGLVYGIYCTMTGTPFEPGLNPIMLLMAALGAATGVGLTFLIAAMIPTRHAQPFHRQPYAPATPEYSKLQPGSANPYNPYDEDYKTQ